MRDIPVFTTENGVASLLLKRIPYTKEAYVHIRASQSCDALVGECIDLCRMAGAQKVYATGHTALSSYPLACSVLRLCVRREQLPQTDAVAVPIVFEQIQWWRQLYNQKMAPVPTAALLSVSDVEELIRSESAYYICRECEILGIGVAFDGQIHAVASARTGGGRDAVLALANCLESQVISLCVASGNEKALRLYNALGFAEKEKEADWYQIF